jgi:glucokinase
LRHRHCQPDHRRRGHVTLAAADKQEARVIALLHERFGHASAERALSGPGLVNLCQAAATLADRTAQSLTPADVIARGRAGTDPLCQTVIGLFCSLLGNVAGNLALTLGAAAACTSAPASRHGCCRSCSV